jgi:hypothetical protein
MLSKRMILEHGHGQTKPDRVKRKAASIGGLFVQWFESQLPSLLARFHEISSPMVELVLETGCL